MKVLRAAPALLAVIAAAALAGAASAQGPMMFGGPGRFNNPTMSNTMGLLMRPEVQVELRLDLRQKNAINDLQDQSSADMRQRMQQLFQNQRQNMQNMQGLSPQERRAQMQQNMAQMQPQIQATIAAFQGEIDEKVKAILTPKQVQRLHQLDLQRRGILSLADNRVAEELQITPETRPEIVKIVSAWQQQQGDIMQKAFEEWRQKGGPQSGQFPDFTSKLSPIKQKLDANQKAAEDKVAALLTPEEKARWNAALGAPFTFRADPPMQNNWMRGGNRGRGGAGGGRGGGGAGGGANGGG